MSQLKKTKNKHTQNQYRGSVSVIYLLCICDAFLLSLVKISKGITEQKWL